MTATGFAPTVPIVTRAQLPDGRLQVLLDCSEGSLTVELIPVIGKVSWSFLPGAGGRVETGADIAWRHGRLIAVGRDARRFFELKTFLGLSFGQIEAELREMTEYVEGSE